ncbi:MAG: NAD(P)-dependent oxidoreductase [Candidatus Margulisbacteria bacterium]|nr:NAD(P)-dependent oxidoreductase [Candidatus Margulisiibacteriota bacterium]
MSKNFTSSSNSSKAKVFITGITGCVGHYLFDLLIKNPDYELYLLVRNPSKMQRDLSAFSNVKIVRDDLRNIKNQAEILKEMDYVVHIAAGWGETEANYEFTINLFKLLNPDKLKKVIYFSTASLLGDDNKVSDLMDKIGTSYIRGKYLCHKKLPELPIYDRIVTLFPTWVLGGDETHPYSHAMEGIMTATKWLWLIRFFSFEISFHFIHAADIALMVDYLLKNETGQKEYILGNDLISAQNLIRQICEFYHSRVYGQLNIPSSLVKLLAGKKLSSWDKYCLDKKIFEYNVVNPVDFGLQPKFESINQVLTNLMHNVS